MCLLNHTAYVVARVAIKIIIIFSLVKKITVRSVNFKSLNNKISFTATIIWRGKSQTAIGMLILNSIPTPHHFCFFTQTESVSLKRDKFKQRTKSILRIQNHFDFSFPSIIDG